MPIVALLTLAAAAPAAGQTPPPAWNSLGFGWRTSEKGLKMRIPEISLSRSEKEALAAGKPVVRMMDSPDGYKIGYLRFLAPFDPVTAWMVVTDFDHYDFTDQAFDATGSLSQKRRTLWPYAFENDTCEENGQFRVAQLIVMPILAARELCLVGYFNSDAFPWESHLDLAGENRCCMSRTDPEMESYYKKALVVKRNREAWYISPLPESLRKTPADIMRADCIYLADVNPGGHLSGFDPIANAAATSTLPQIMRHVVIHGRRWEGFLREQYGDKELCAYRQWVARYRESMGSRPSPADSATCP